MCTTNIYTTVYPDGRRETSRVPSLCSHSRHGIPCPKNVIFQHPPSYVSNAGKASSAPTGSPFLPPTGHFPPSPAYTPRSGTPNNHRSGDESDRSGGYRSGSSSRSKKSPTVYINGQRVYELDPYASPSSSSSRRHKERVVVREGPPSPHTPPAAFSSPHTGASASSPTAPYVVDAKPRRPSSSHRTNPVIIENTRPLSGIDVVDPREFHASQRHHHASRRHSKHSRHASTSSYDSSSRRSHDEEEAAAARHRRRERKQREYEQAEQVYAQRSAKYNDRIAAANAHIANRPAVPMPPPPPRRSNTSAYRDAELADAVHGLSLDGGRRRPSRSQEAEDEAMKQRLKDRMMPRRATVSGRPPRHQVLYDDGTVRWE